MAFYKKIKRTNDFPTENFGVLFSYQFCLGFHQQKSAIFGLEAVLIAGQYQAPICPIYYLVLIGTIDPILLLKITLYLLTWDAPYPQENAHIRFGDDLELNFSSNSFNRYRQGLETCPQAKTSKSGQAIFFSFFRRVRATSMTQRRVENTRVHFWTFSPVSVKDQKIE